jgi:hypothetical protein
MDIYKSEFHTIPYFYIISHKQTGIKYAGSKWAKGCHPDTFWVPGGYYTSSETIHSIIKTDGVEAFEVLEIISDLGSQSAYDYESTFLLENDCANSKDWYNMHNNVGNPFYSDGYTQVMLERYGVERPCDSEMLRDIAKATCLENHGVEYGFHTTEGKANKRKTFADRYGVTNPLQIPEAMGKKKETCKEKYGYEHPWLSEEIQAKRVDTFLERYGHTNFKKSETGRNQTSAQNEKGLARPIYKEYRALIQKHGLKHKRGVHNVKDDRLQEIINDIRAKFGS